jgi:hypothetical protein
VPNLNSLTTFSGLFAFFAVMALMYGRFTIASVLLMIGGSGGLAITWDRWSARAGDQVHVTAFLDGPKPSGDELWMIGTHGPMLVLGLTLLSLIVRRMARVVPP